MISVILQAYNIYTIMKNAEPLVMVVEKVV
jgi:hypothetical protein